MDVFQLWLIIRVVNHTSKLLVRCNLNGLDEWKPYDRSPLVDQPIACILYPLSFRICGEERAGSLSFKSLIGFLWKRILQTIFPLPGDMHQAPCFKRMIYIICSHLTLILVIWSYRQQTTCVLKVYCKYWNNDMTNNGVNIWVYLLMAIWRDRF